MNRYRKKECWVGMRDCIVLVLLKTSDRIRERKREEMGK